MNFMRMKHSNVKRGSKRISNVKRGGKRSSSKRGECRKSSQQGGRDSKKQDNKRKRKQCEGKRSVKRGGSKRRRSCSMMDTTSHAGNCGYELSLQQQENIQYIWGERTEEMSRLWDNFHNSRNEMLMAQSISVGTECTKQDTARTFDTNGRRGSTSSRVLSASRTTAECTREKTVREMRRIAEHSGDAEHCNECTGSKIASKD